MNKKLFVIGLLILLSILFFPMDTQVTERKNRDPLLTKQWSLVAKHREDISHKETSLSGAEIYMRNCAGCHGEEGAGDGPVADSFDPRPRDFTSGHFAFRSTEYGGMPSDEDLLRTISEGIRWSAMPAFGKILSRKEREAILAHVKTLSKFYDEKEWYNFFELRGEPDPIAVPPAPKPTAEIIELGRKLYGDAEGGFCYKCHGESGIGNGPSAEELKDAWDRPIRPANLTRHIYKRGSDAREIYLRIRTGLPGTPMPETDDFDLSDDEVWAVALYVKSFQQEPEDWLAGGKLYYKAFGCIQCHAPDGAGGVKNPNYARETIPPLNTLAENMLLMYEEDADLVGEILEDNGNLGEDRRFQEILRSQAVLAQYHSIGDVIRNGNPAGSADPEGPLPAIPFMPAYEGILSDQDVSAIIAYLLTLQPWEVID